MLKELREFAIKGNVVDMAVGIIIGAAFTTLVKSLVDDVIMPPLGLLTNGLDFADKYLVLQAGNPAGPYASLAQARSSGANVLAYGSFVNNLVTLLIVSTVLFFVVRWINKLRRSDTPDAPNTKACGFCKLPIDRKATRCPHCTSQLETAAS